MRFQLDHERLRQLADIPSGKCAAQSGKQCSPSGRHGYHSHEPFPNLHTAGRVTIFLLDKRGEPSSTCADELPLKRYVYQYHINMG